MAIIPKTPTAKQFAERWTREFGAAVQRAAGKDGRLTTAEVKKLAQRPDADRFFADNALNYLAACGKKSVSVRVLVAEAKAYSERAATTAAGSDGKLSLPDGKKLPADLVEDFFYLRGRATAAKKSPSSLGALETKLSAAVKDLYVLSETDATLKFVSAPGIGNAPITPDLIRARLGAQHDALLSQVMYVDPADLPLATRTFVETRDAKEWLEARATPSDLNDPASAGEAKRFKALGELLTSQLTDLTLVRFGPINISVFLVGRTANGELAGLLTGLVET